MPSVNKLAKSKHGKSKNGKRCASVKLPFVRAVNDDPIPPLSPVLCNHYYPKLRLVKPEDNGLYWVCTPYLLCIIKFCTSVIVY